MTVYTSQYRLLSRLESKYEKSGAQELWDGEGCGFEFAEGSAAHGVFELSARSEDWTGSDAASAPYPGEHRVASCRAFA
jgi:hypothetical protein